MPDTMPSWRRKLRRAQKHFNEVERAVRAYEKKRPYRAERGTPDERHPDRWRFLLRITEQPDPDIAVAFGDYMFNLRSALDHIACAVAPPDRKHQAGFPIEHRPIFDLAPDGGYVMAKSVEQRDLFERMVRGMPEEAVAFIKSRQPYNLRESGVTGLGALSTLQNADKHRSLTLLAVGILGPEVVVTWPGGQRGFPVMRYAEADAELVSHADLGGRRVDGAEVDVQVSGTPDVQAVVRGPSPGEYGLLPLAASMTLAVADDVIPGLERFVP